MVTSRRCPSDERRVEVVVGLLGTFGNFPSFLSGGTLDLQVPASISHRGSDRILLRSDCMPHGRHSSNRMDVCIVMVFLDIQ